VCHENFDHHGNRRCVARAHWNRHDSGYGPTYKTVQIHKPVRAVHVAHARPAAHYAARYRGPRNQLGFDIGQFIQGMLDLYHLSLLELSKHRENVFAPRHL
jgi:hypothetical protein